MTTTPQQAAEEFAANVIQNGYEIEAIYEYQDAKGIPVYWKIRARNSMSGAKWIRPMKPIDEGYSLSEPLVAGGKPLYWLPSIAEEPAAPVWIVEGENKVEVLRQLGLCATTSGSATSADRTDWKPLAQRSVIIWPDNDDAGKMYAKAVTNKLTRIGRQIKLIDVKQLNLPVAGDVVDWLKMHPTATKADIEALPSIEQQTSVQLTVTKPLSTEALTKELAGLSSLEYERRRKKVADDLGVRVTSLDAAVEKLRPPSTNTSGMLFVEPDPWLTPVAGDVLLDELSKTFSRHLVLPDNAADAMALWVMSTYCHDVARISPILGFLSPDKRCGKTTALSLVGALVRKSLPTSNITAAPLFRSIEKYNPTLVIDEADTFLKKSDELRGIINSGHNRDNAFVIRSCGDDHEPTKFSTFCPKAIALIGQLPPTLTDRSIVIQMKRKRPDEKVARFRADKTDGALDLKRQALRWSSDHMSVLSTMDPTVSEEFNDRAADNWRPLLSIADLAGGNWSRRARQAMASLSGEIADDTAGIMLLEDVNDAFKLQKTGTISSTNLVSALTRITERSWGSWNRGKPISPTQVARLLKPFGISSKNFRTTTGVQKGYDREQFDDAFSRYVSRTAATPLQASSSASSVCSGVVTATNPTVAGDVGANAVETKGCSVVAANGGKLDDNAIKEDEALKAKFSTYVPCEYEIETYDGVVKVDPPLRGADAQKR